MIEVRDIETVRVMEGESIMLTLWHVGGALQHLNLSPDDKRDIPAILKRMAQDCTDAAVRAQERMDMADNEERLQAIRRMSGDDLAGAETAPRECVGIAEEVG